MDARNLKVIIASTMFLGLFVMVYAVPINTKDDLGVDELILKRDNEAADTGPDKDNAKEDGGLSDDGLETTALPKDEMNGKSDELGDSKDWKNSVLRIKIQSKDDCVETVGDDLKAEFDNTTLPPLICWEMECPDCADNEPPHRCFARPILTLFIRSLIFLFVMGVFACCVMAMRPKGKSRGKTETRDRTRDMIKPRDIENKEMDEDIEQLLTNKNNS